MWWRTLFDLFTPQSDTRAALEKPLASSRGCHGKPAAPFLLCECSDAISMCVSGRLFATYIMVNGGIIAGREREVMSWGSAEENTVKWMCSPGEMTSHPTPHPPVSPSLHGSQTKCFPLNCAISPCSGPYIIVSVSPLARLLSPASLSPAGALHQIVAETRTSPHFILV